MIHDKRDLGAFIPSYLDDYGLECDEFRVYARIARRAGSGKCFESVENISKACKIGALRVREVIHFLSLTHMIAVFPRQGKPNEYALTSNDSWKPQEELEEIRSQAYKQRTRTKKWRDNNTPHHSEPLITVRQGHSDTPHHGDTPTPYHRDECTPHHGDRQPLITVTVPNQGLSIVPYASQGSEGTPMEVTPKKGTPNEGTPVNKESAGAQIVLGTGQIFSSLEVNPEEKSPPSPPAAISPTEKKWERYREAYNANKPAMWSRVDKPSSDRQRAIKKLEKECGGMDQAIACMIDALAFAKTDKFWGGNKMGFDNLFRDGRVIQFHENFVSRQARPQAFNDFVENPANIRLAETRSRMLRAIQASNNQEINHAG